MPEDREKKLLDLLAKSKATLLAMTPEAREEMYRRQKEGWVKAEVSWPKAKFKWVGGVKVYESWEDYCND